MCVRHAADTPGRDRVDVAVCHVNGNPPAYAGNIIAFSGRPRSHLYGLFDLTSSGEIQTGHRSHSLNMDPSRDPPAHGLPQVGGANSHEDSLPRSRAYQLEMFEASLERNIIVAVCPSGFASCICSSTESLRWTLGVARHTCEDHGRLELLSPSSSSHQPLEHYFASWQSSSVATQR